ncbi:S24 family peptidase [Parabacteroides sp. PF5-9]|uniref:S24 family peptidase n=1 Tax=Parabacteroides sp. PF5-9 TaxID=1742404 RepID=UPI002474D29A|nr:S24 family peptidase [Parabacteroides sp. PF5-9]MDH6358244.1 phage repressor protein C with HTH and peptisase S24 domain [Parabacteroides sp. PF5-9]
METTINERIKLISEKHFNGNLSAMSRAVSVRQPTLRDIVGERQSSPGYDTIRSIVDSSSLGINADWLITGEGEMYKSGNIQLINQPQTSEQRLEEQEVALYDVSAAANLKALFCAKTQHILGKIRIPDMPKCDGAIYVTGDSMYPLLKSGDIVIYKEIQDFQNIFYGEMYLLAMEIEGDEYLTVKYVNKSEKEGSIKLVSYNTHHEPMDVSLTDIQAMALVKLSIRKNTMR